MAIPDLQKSSNILAACHFFPEIAMPSWMLFISVPYTFYLWRRYRLPPFAAKQIVKFRNRLQINQLLHGAPDRNWGIC
jgi:hypothetical protein